MDRKQAARAIVTTLTVYAFGNSYLHGVSWVQENSNGAAIFDWGTPAIPELILISCLLRGKFDLKAVVGGVFSIGWTFWVNGASAAAGVSGMVVALSPPFAAVLCAWFLDGDESTPKKPAAKKKLGVVEGGIQWLFAQNVTYTVEEIMQIRGCSRKSAILIREAVPAVAGRKLRRV